MKKSELLQIITADEIATGLDILAHSAQTLQLQEIHNDALLLIAQWERLDKDEHEGIAPTEALQQGRNRVKHALITLANSLPEALPEPPAAPARRPAGIPEPRFKRQLFVFMLLAKAWIIYWVLFHKESGGFSSGEALATISLLLPAFTAYTSVMLADILRLRKRPHAPAAYAPRVDRSLQWFTWALLLTYVYLLHSLVGAKAAGTLADNAPANFENMTRWLAIVESGLGVYVGLIVGAFFRK